MSTTACTKIQQHHSRCTGVCTDQKDVQIQHPTCTKMKKRARQGKQSPTLPRPRTPFPGTDEIFSSIRPPLYHARVNRPSAFSPCTAYIHILHIHRNAHILQTTMTIYLFVAGIKGKRKRNITSTSSPFTSAAHTRFLMLLRRRHHLHATHTYRRRLYAPRQRQHQRAIQASVYHKN